MTNNSQQNTYDTAGKLVVGDDDPELAAKVIEALSEKTRLAVLAEIISAKDGTTASDIAERVNKKIPTILYHLDILSHAGLVTIELKQKVPGVGRPVKHWKVAKKAVQIEIDIPTLVLFAEPLSSIIRDLLTYYRDTKRELAFGIPVDPRDIIETASRPLTLAQAELICAKITTDRLLDYCVGFMIKEFEERRADRVNPLGIGKRCAIDGELAQQVFYRLIATGRFHVEGNRLIRK
ncbi:MAG: ArsR/SmtB family transcription factor [Candidatus Heimdallarchaeota archaeon]